jgi:hypothetical protein
MKPMRPLLQLTGYYLVLAAVVAIVATRPELAAYLPLGSNGNLSAGAAELLTGQPRAMSWEPVQQASRLAIALVGVILLMQPVAWVYMGARRKRGKEQSFIITVLLLPVAVAAIVLIVQNSLALAFSLAGVVAGVRFRLTLRTPWMRSTSSPQSAWDLRPASKRVR